MDVAASASTITWHVLLAEPQPGRLTSITSTPQRASAASTAASMTGSTSTSASLIRPTRVAAATSTENPGSSSASPAATPATSRAIGPIVSMLGASGHTPASAIRPCVVFSPVIPQNATGPGSSRRYRTRRPDPPRRPPPRPQPRSTAARDPAGIERIDRRAEVRVHPARPERQLIQVGLAHDPDACRRASQARRVALAGAAVAASARLPAVVGTPATSIRSLTANRIPSPEVGSRVMKVVTGTPYDRPGGLPGPACRLPRMEASTTRGQRETAGMGVVTAA